MSFVLPSHPRETNTFLNFHFMALFFAKCAHESLLFKDGFQDHFSNYSILIGGASIEVNSKDPSSLIFQIHFLFINYVSEYRFILHLLCPPSSTDLCPSFSSTKRQQRQQPFKLFHPQCFNSVCLCVFECVYLL